jgi:DNA repair exonuclease SbcCD ATPase subunit
MRIDRLRLTDYRGIEHAEVRFAPTGVTIVEGDNEVGKTSLTEALDLVLTVRDDSKKEAVRNLQPYGRDVGPEVEVELTTGPHRFVLRKRWLRRPETVLEVLEPEREVLTGREAHDRAQALLRATVDTELWAALRLEQGADAGLATYAVPSLGRALDRAAGGAAGREREDDLWERIVAERARYWTPTGRPSAERDRLAERLAAAEEEVRLVDAELRQLESHVDEMARLEADAADLATRQRELDAQVEQLQVQQAEVEALRREVADHTAELRAATAERDRWAHALERRAEAVAAVEERTHRVAAAEAAVAQAAPAAVAAAQRHEAAAAERADAGARLAEAEEAHHRAQADLAHRRHEIEVAQLTERHDRVTAHRAALAEAEAVLDAVTVDDAAVAGIEAAHLEVVRAEAAAAAGAASLVVRAPSATAVELDGETVQLAPGEPLERSVTATSHLEVPGVLEVEVRAGAEARVLAERLLAARADLHKRCQRAGVADLSAARAAAARRVDALRIRDHAQQRITEDLRDLSVDDLARKVARLAAKVEAYEAARPAAPPLPATFDLAQAEAAEAEATLAAVRAAVGATDTELAAAQSAVRDAEVASAGLGAQLQHAREALEQAEAALAAARAAEPDALLTEEHAAAERSHQAAADQLAVAEGALRRHGADTLEDLVSNALQAQSRGRAALLANRDARRGLESVLETKGEQGLAQRHDLALTDRDRLRGEHERLEARAVAARVLHDTFEARRAAAHARYVAPFKEAIERLGRVVFGPSLEVELDADLRISARRLDGTRLPFDQLSTGAREQLGIISRLACATIVAGDDGAPVILDDTLGWTDPRRLAQMAAAIGVAGRSCQIVLLTCTPGRFAHVGGATVVRLPGPGPELAARSTA